jgi:hypothetical protein
MTAVASDEAVYALSIAAMVVELSGVEVWVEWCFRVFVFLARRARRGLKLSYCTGNYLDPLRQREARYSHRRWSRHLIFVGTKSRSYYSA